MKKTIPTPGESDNYYGQDAQYSGIQPSFQDNEDGTVTDKLILSDHQVNVAAGFFVDARILGP